MEVIHLSGDLSHIPDACVTALGFFDGVHRGHQALLRAAVRTAAALGCAPAVFTFDPADPAYDKSAHHRLTTAEERLSLFETCGIQYVFYADFAAVRDLSPAEFVSQILIALCHTKTAVCGYNFRFGRSAAGDPAELRRLMHAHRGRCTIIPPKTYRDEEDFIISSSIIRVLIGRGDMPTARRLLGRPYALTAPVEHGKRLGRTIGFPTINQRFPVRAVIPAHGVYDVTCEVDGVLYHGIANVGVRPTVDDTEEVNCETHIIGFDGDLYGRTVTVRFIRMLRREMQFRSVEELQAAITKNLEEMKQTYGNRMDQAHRTRRTRRP